MKVQVITQRPMRCGDKQMPQDTLLGELDLNDDYGVTPAYLGGVLRMGDVKYVYPDQEKADDAGKGTNPTSSANVNKADLPPG